MLHRPSRKTIFIVFALFLVLLGLTAFYVVVIYDPGCCVAPSPPAKLSLEVNPATPRPPFSQTSSNKMGVHLLLDDGRNQWPESIWQEHLEVARQVVGEWGYVTELVRLDDLNVGRWQKFMDICAKLHLRPILRLATTGNFTSSERMQFLGWAAPRLDEDGTYRSTAQQYADFVAKLEWPTDQHFIIVGNEPNHGAEWGGGLPDPAGYARLLIDVADALHAQDKYAVVMNAGFDPYAPMTKHHSFIQYGEFMDEETFLDQMIAAYPDVFLRIDAWASHSYPLGPFSQPPWEQTYQIDVIQDDSDTSPINSHHQEPPEGVFNRGVNGYQWELWKLSTYGVPPLPVMITETGWRHAETSDPNATDTGANLPDAATVGIYFDLAFNGNNGRYPEYPETGWTAWQDDPRVIGVTTFALDGYPAEWGHTNWLELDTDGKILGTYSMFNLFVPTE